MSDYIVHKAVELSALSAKTTAELETNTEWIISPKYDGCHAIFCFDNGKHVATYSRSGETVLSMPHIAQDLIELYPVQDGRVAICGEAWIVGKEFNEVSGAFRRQSPQAELQFVPFDIVPFDYNTDASGPPVLLGQLDHRQYPATYLSRITSLRDGRRAVRRISSVLVPKFWVFTNTSVRDIMREAIGFARNYKANAYSFYDGAVLAKANGKYIVGSGKGGEFIKCKPLLSETVTVTAVISDIGGKTGKNTCVLCFHLNGEIQKVSTGIVQSQADDWTNDPSLIIGQRIEVEAMGLTKNGFLREPRFKGIRSDA